MLMCVVQYSGIPVHGSAEEHMWNIQTHDLIWNWRDLSLCRDKPRERERERDKRDLCMHVSKRAFLCYCVWVKLLYDWCLFITNVSVKHYFHIHCVLCSIDIVCVHTVTTMSIWTLLKISSLLKKTNNRNHHRNYNGSSATNTITKHYYLYQLLTIPLKIVPCICSFETYFNRI